MQIVDTHMHLYLEEFDDDRNFVVERAVASGNKRLLLPNIDKDTIAPMFECCDKFHGVCLPMLGLHPTSVKDEWEEELDFIIKQFQNRYFCAIGETGIDLYWDTEFAAQQEKAFVKQLDMAVALEKPVVIHSRNSVDLVLEILSDYKKKNLTGVLHCFPGNESHANKAVEMGFMLGIGGVVTYKNSMMRKVVETAPLESLLLETDAPFLAPAPYRGKRNESSYLVNIAAEIAYLKGFTTDHVAEITAMNADKLFNLNLYVK